VTRPRTGGLPRSAWLAIGAVAAALGGPLVGPGASLVGAAALATAALGLARIDRRRDHAVALGGLALGTAAVAVRLWLAGPLPPPPPLPTGSGPWTAVVVGVGTPRDGSQVATVELAIPDNAIRLAATLPRYPEIVPGDTVLVGGSVQPPPDDDYGAYLRRTGAAGTLRARTLERSVPAADWTVDALRRRAGDALQAAMPEPEAGLAAGILIGLRERVDRDLAADFATAGASHVVAISGWNIALVAGIVAGLLRGRGSRSRLLLTVGAITAYTIAAGASPSVLRAAVMAGVVLLARGSGRAGRAAPALAWAAALLIVIDPSLAADAGFQLSVVATAGLLAWASPLSARLGRVGGGRMPGWLAEGLGVSLAAQAATLPIVLASFGRLSLIAPAVNLAVVPLVPIAMAAGVIALVGGTLVLLGAPAVVGTALGLPAWLALTLIVRIVRVGASVPAASIDLGPEAAIPAAIVATLALGLAVWWRRRPRRTAALTGLEALLPARRSVAKRSAVLIALVIATVGSFGLAGLAVAERADRATELTVLDVGQGDAILLESARGSRLLIDGGPDPDRLLVALDERIPAWDRRLDVVVLSHPHEDHVAGLAALLQRYAVGRVFEPGMHGPGPGWQAWDAELADDGIPRGHLSTGGRLRLDEVGMTVLWPDRDAVPLEPADTGTGINNVSIVLLGEVGRRRFLLAGDIEEGIDPTLLKRGIPRVDVLKVAHHGSATASTDAFLDAARPSVAVASAGAGNRYGHPAPGTLARLREHGARVYRTDKDGSVAIRIADDAIRVTNSGPRAAVAGRTILARGSPPPFTCGIVRPLGSPKVDPAPSNTASVGRIARAGPRSVATVPPRYHPPDDGPRARGGGPPAVLPGAPGLVRAARRRGGGGRGVAGAASHGSRDRDRPVGRRGGRAPSRRRQAAPPRRSPPRAAPRRGLRGVARGEGPCGAGRAGA
jgi:competence protein ComEC